MLERLINQTNRTFRPVVRANFHHLRRILPISNCDSSQLYPLRSGKSQAARAMRLMARRCSTINSSIRYCALRPAPQLQHAGKLWLVRELPKNRRRTEVPVSFSGSAGAVGRHNNNSK